MGERTSLSSQRQCCALYGCVCDRVLCDLHGCVVHRCVPDTGLLVLIESTPPPKGGMVMRVGTGVVGLRHGHANMWLGRVIYFALGSGM